MKVQQLDPQVAKVLAELLVQLKENEVVKHYHEMAFEVENNKRLAELEEQIKKAQKDTVNFAHYGKLEAAKQAKKQADELTAQFNSDPLVVAYREALYEANDLLQYLTTLIEEEVNEELQK